MKFSSRQGFTLIETLVVVAVFAAITTLSLVIFNPKAQLEKGNDAKRQGDLSQIKTSLDAYYNDNNKYPDSLNELISKNYIKAIPKDPSCPKTSSCSNDYVYLAEGINPQWYVLFSQLKSPEISTPCPYTCTGVDPIYNYCSFEGAIGSACTLAVSSPAVTLPAGSVTPVHGGGLMPTPGSGSLYQVPVLSLKYLPVKPCGSPSQKIDVTNATATSNVNPVNAKGAVDANMNSKWAPSSPFNGIEVTVDLGAVSVLRDTILRFYGTDMPEMYHIDVSTTGAFAGEQTRIVTETNSIASYQGEGKNYSFGQVNARYIRLTFDAYRSNNIAGNGYQVNFYEWEFYSSLPSKQCINTSITGTSGVVSNPDDPDPLAYMRNRLNSDNQTVINTIREGSKYHGYKDPGAVSSIGHFIYDDKEFLTAAPVSPVFTNPPRPDYNGILNNVNICDYVDNKGVKEVWMWSYHSWQTVPEESDMAMGKVSKSFWNMPQPNPNAKWNTLPNAAWGDISNSSQANDLPVCNKTYVLFNFSYNSGVANAIHDYFHQMENVLGYADHTMFWDMYTGKQYGFAGPRRCGNAHAPPNLDAEYNYAFKNSVKSDCEDWQPVNCTANPDINADCGGTRKTFNCDEWGCDEIKYYTWWMQNIPGLNNTIKYQGKNLRNWWEFFGDFDAAMARGKSLVEL